jgi:nicotinic acid mononucleotide adenylyltransferase
MNLVKLVESENPPRIYVIATGAGSTIQTKLWSQPGASKYLVGCQFPYAQEATVEVLGFTPEKFVSPETAIALAQKAYYHALASPRPGPAVGLGMTCSVASLVEHRGEHRIITAVVTDNVCLYTENVLRKGVGAWQRRVDDSSAEYEAGKMLACVTEGMVPPGERVSTDWENNLRDGQALGRKVWFEKPWHRDGECFGGRILNATDRCLFVPGAFNPIHQGHENLIKAAQLASGLRPILSITANPPHKSHLTVPEMIAKVRHLKGHTVYFNQDPLFIDQARRFPGCSFAIGADAMDRMLDPKWCPVEPMLAEFKTLGTRFFVSPRLVGSEYLRMSDVLVHHRVPAKFADLFWAIQVPRLDISSTQIREGK